MVSTFKTKEEEDAFYYEAVTGAGLSNEDYEWIKHHAPPPQLPPLHPSSSSCAKPSSKLEPIRRAALLPTPPSHIDCGTSSFAQQSTFICSPPEGYAGNYMNITMTTFRHIEPYIMDQANFHIVRSPLIYALNKSELVQCYLTDIPTLGLWSMSDDDVVNINSIIFDLAKTRNLYGQVSYFNFSHRHHHHHHHIKIDRYTIIANALGKKVSRRSRSVFKNSIQDVEAHVLVKISGISHNTTTNIIVPIITCEAIYLKRALDTTKKKNQKKKKKNASSSTSSSSSTLQDRQNKNRRLLPMLPLPAVSSEAKKNKRKKKNMFFPSADTNALYTIPHAIL